MRKTIGIWIWRTIFYTAVLIALFWIYVLPDNSDPIAPSNFVYDGF